MTTINPVSSPVTQSPTFRGKNKKTMEVIDKLAFQLPQEAINQAAFKDIRKPVAEDAYAAAHKTAAEMIDRIAGLVCGLHDRPVTELQETVMREAATNPNFVKGINDALAKDAAKNCYHKF